MYHVISVVRNFPETATARGLVQPFYVVGCNIAWWITAFNLNANDLRDPRFCQYPRQNDEHLKRGNTATVGPDTKSRPKPC